MKTTIIIILILLLIGCQQKEEEIIFGDEPESHSMIVCEPALENYSDIELEPCMIKYIYTRTPDFVMWYIRD